MVEISPWCVVMVKCLSKFAGLLRMSCTSVDCCEWVDCLEEKKERRRENRRRGRKKKEEEGNEEEAAEKEK